MPTPAARILLVDDDDVFRSRLARALRDRGRQVVEAASAETAMAAAQPLSPDAAVLDLKMPGAGGLACLRELRAAWQDLRVLILTGYGSIATALEAVRLGAWDYLTKPADADQILHALEHTPGHAGPADRHPPPPSLERLEWEHIQRVLSDHGGNISHAAEALGIHRRSLQRKLHKYPPGR